MFVSNASSGTLVQQLLPRRGILSHAWVSNMLLILGGSLFVALCAQIRIPLPFSPVPITAQTLGVLLVGSLLGSRLGLGSMILYIAMGLVGLPFFAGGGSGVQYVFGATAGYLVAFPFAAALTGWLAERGWDRRMLTMILSMIMGNAVIYVLGVSWLAWLKGFEFAIVNGMLIFIVGDILKIAIAAIALPGGWKLLGSKQTTDHQA